AMRPILRVVRLIAAQDPAAWPGSDFWTANLPHWLLASLPERSIEEARYIITHTPREKWHDIPWDLNSWLDAIRERGWEWWGYTIGKDNVLLSLKINDMPPRIEAFKVLLAAGNVEIIDEKFS